MNILAVEASTQACSVSILAADKSYTEFELAPQRHANIMLSQVDRVLSRAEMTANDIDYLAFGEGPGAFTGVRIAAGVIQGLAFGWRKPVINVSSLEAIAFEALAITHTKDVLACLDARMKEIYVQHCSLDGDLLISQPAQLLSAPDFKAYQQDCLVMTGAGDIQKEYPETTQLFKEFVEVWPNAEAIAQIAAQRTQTAINVEETPPVPVYLRNNIADKKSPV